MGQFANPEAIARKGVTDLVRISDGRMSGTHYGTCILHVSPESTAGGPLALLRTGDAVRLDVPGRTLDMLVEEEEVDRQRAAWVPQEPEFAGAYAKFYRDHVLQADQGCDFDFLDGLRQPREPATF